MKKNKKKTKERSSSRKPKNDPKKATTKQETDIESSPELFFGLVGPSGAQIDRIADNLEQILRQLRYKLHRVKLTNQLLKIDGAEEICSKVHGEDVRIRRLQDAGNSLRHISKNAAAMVQLGLQELRRKRDLDGERRAYLIDQIKHPGEVAYLRGLYRDNFLLIAGTAPRKARRNQLASRIATSRNQTGRDQFYDQAEKIMYRDAKEHGNNYGQNVSEAFPEADLFVDTTNRSKVKRQVERFIRLLFGDPFKTPRRDEFAMYHAQASALRSADMGRQVGAAIAQEGNIVAVGTNEVPKAGGGLYWEEEDENADDDRDFQRGEDGNVTFKKSLFREVIQLILDKKGFNESLQQKNAETLRKELMPGTQIEGLLEFGRAVHAEMAALMDAAYRGVSVRDSTLYTTTFPCHMCAKHIVAAGIREVVFIQPFRKSRTAELYLDSDVFPVVEFRPFVGVAPRQYMQLFSIRERGLKRKDLEGKAIEWDARSAKPWKGGSMQSYEQDEGSDSDEIQENIGSYRMTLSEKGEVRYEKIE